jgi:hypothetical protein
MISIQIARPEPFGPPKGRTDPPPKTCIPSVVGRPWASRPNPSAIASPCIPASRIFPRATMLMAMSRTKAGRRPAGTPTARGFTPRIGFVPPNGGMPAEELVKANPMQSAAMAWST